MRQHCWKNPDFRSQFARGNVARRSSSHAFAISIIVRPQNVCSFRQAFRRRPSLPFAAAFSQPDSVAKLQRNAVESQCPALALTSVLWQQSPRRVARSSMANSS
jgi:hypothetical protein